MRGLQISDTILSHIKLSTKALRHNYDDSFKIMIQSHLMVIDVALVLNVSVKNMFLKPQLNGVFCGHFSVTACCKAAY